MLRFIMIFAGLMVSFGAFAQQNKDSVRVEFLSHTDRIYEMLQDRQEAAYKLDKRAYRWGNSAEEFALLDSLASRYNLNKDSLRSSIKQYVMTTEFENPVSYSILKWSIGNVESQLKAKGVNFISPRYGTLPEANLNAYMNNSIPGSPLIIVNSGIFNYCHELTKIALETISFSSNSKNVSFGYDKETLLDKLVTNNKLLVRFSMALEDYSNKRRITGKAPADSSTDRILIHLVDGMELFITAHEYGHLLLKHEPMEVKSVERKLINGEDQTSIEKLRKSWQQEIEADVFGFLLLNEYIKKHPSSFDGLMQSAPYFYFSLAQIGDESGYLMLHKRTSDVVPAAERQSYINLINNMAGNSFASVAMAGKMSSFNFKVKPTKKDQKIVLPFDGHPPNWLRAELIRTLIDQNSASIDTTFKPLVMAFSDNLRYCWENVSDQWVEIMNGRKPKPIDPKLVEAALARKQKKEQQEKLNGQLDDYLEDERLKREPPACDSLRVLGLDLFTQKQYKKSIDVLLQAEACGVSSGSLYFALGSSYLDTDDYPNAIVYYTKSIKKFNDSTAAYFWDYGNRAMAYRYLGKLNLAEQDFKTAFKTAFREDPKLYRERALLLIDLKRSREAVGDYQKAVKLDPQNIPYVTELYEAQLIDGNFKAVIGGRKTFLSLKAPKKYLLIFDFLEYASRLQLGHDTRSVETELSGLLKSDHALTWYFDQINLALKRPIFNQRLNAKILKFEDRIKLVLKGDP